MPARGYDTGAPNTGSTGKYSSTLPGASLGGAALKAGLRPDPKPLAAAITSVSSDTWECQPGYRLVQSGGALVCRNTSTGNEIPPQMKTSTSGGGGSARSSSSATPGEVYRAVETATGAKGNSESDYLMAAADTFARNPQALLADILERSHPDDNGGLGIYHMLAPYGDAANVIFLGQVGQDAGGGTKDQFINWLEDDYWNALMTPGATIDVESVINNALNPAANSPLAAYLAVGTPEQQARNFQNLYAGAMQVGYHPLIADAMNYRMNYAANEFLGETARGEVDPFYQWIQTSMPSITRAY